MGGKRGRPPKPLNATASAQAFLGAELRRLRAERGLVLAGLAGQIGYSAQHIGAVERGTVTASEQFVAACDVSLDADGHLVALFEAAVREQAASRHRRHAARRRMPPAVRVDETSDDVDWERLEATTRRRARPSAAVVDDLALITERHRSLYHRLPATQMIDCAAAPLSTLRAVLDTASDQKVLRQLAAMAQETTGLVAWLRHDMTDLAASEAAYRLADRLLEASGNRLLAGYVTAFRAVTRSARGDVRAGARDLEIAADQMGRAAPHMPVAWLLALRAEARARQQDRAAALTLLGQADRALDRAAGDPGAEWMYVFDEQRLTAHRGSCFLELGQVADAEVALEQAMQSLPTSCRRRRSELTVKIAMTRVARGDHASAVALCSQALDGFVSAGSAQGLRSVRDVRRRIMAGHGPGAVSALDERLRHLANDGRG